MILARLCEEIFQILYSLRYGINTEYEQDPNYKTDEKAVLIKALNIIQEEEVDKNIKKFDILDLNSEEYFESGSSKFLSIILSVIENNLCQFKIVCEYISIQQLKWLEASEKLKEFLDHMLLRFF